MEPPLVLTHGKLKTFLDCRRRYQLRFLALYRWPDEPLPDRWREAFRRGREFHQLLERYFLGVSPALSPTADKTVQRWWRAFQEDGPSIPDGRRLPEVTLTVPVSNVFLAARFDLLILGPDTATIYDWKTELRPRPERELRADWQTRLYLALLAEGGSALHHEERAYAPRDISLVYWFANNPTAAVTIQYSEAEHAAVWEELVAVVETLEEQRRSTSSWPLTDDLSLCARCAYRVYCGRQHVPARPVAELDEPEADDEPALAPELP